MLNARFKSRDFRPTADRLWHVRFPPTLFSVLCNLREYGFVLSI